LQQGEHQQGPNAGTLIASWRAMRELTLALLEPLSAEDQVAQSMPDASPAKWHAAHTTWFAEAVVLREHLSGYRAFDERYGLLFNSYYEALGARHPRPQRGLLTRPSADEVLRYRAHVDRAMTALIAGADQALLSRLAPLVTLVVHHEQQHQELLLTDIKHLFSLNPMRPAFTPASARPRTVNPAAPLRWIEHAGGLGTVGHGGAGFAFDNEGPRHQVLLQPHALASRTVSCGEWLAFIDDGGYRRPELWLSDGWAAVQTQGWQAPSYWQLDTDGRASVFTLHGEREVDHGEPVCHVSLFEADAYARWAGARLPTEFEWEAGAPAAIANRHDLGELHPVARPTAQASTLDDVGEVWEWTRSSYDPYPGFRTFEGVAAEYNGKFMVGQVVLRGGSCASPPGHLRPSYRNFFPPAARWQFSCVRLAKDL
jgi:ergothioneine biosynthesis protein EgtB